MTSDLVGRSFIHTHCHLHSCSSEHTSLSLVKKSLCLKIKHSRIVELLIKLISPRITIVRFSDLWYPILPMCVTNGRYQGVNRCSEMVDNI